MYIKDLSKAERSIVAKMREKQIQDFSLEEMQRVFAHPCATHVCTQRADKMISTGRLTLEDVQGPSPITQDEKLTMVTSMFQAARDVLADVWQSGQGAPESPDPARAELIVNAIMDDVIAANAEVEKGEGVRAVALSTTERTLLQGLLLRRCPSEIDVDDDLYYKLD